jgi:hypothetical protein
MSFSKLLRRVMPSRELFSSATPPAKGTVWTDEETGRRYRITRLLGPALIEGYAGGIVGASWIVYGKPTDRD